MSLRLRPAAKSADDQAETPAAPGTSRPVTKQAAKTPGRPTSRPAKRGHRAASERDDRRNLYLNLAFAGTVILGVLLLAAAVGANYYEDHFGKVAIVNGQTITKDDLRARVTVDAWRLNRAESSIRNAVSGGRMTQDQANAQLQQLQTSRSAMPKSSLDALVDAALAEQLAAKQGIAIADKQIDDAITTEATSAELRHAWVIEVPPVLGQSELTATDAEKAAAKAKAEQALAAIKAGQKWEDVVTRFSSTDGTAGGKGGDLGWVSKDSGSLDSAFDSALFALPVNGVSDVIEGADGTYRIGRVTEIDAPKTDPNYVQSIKDAGVSIDAYRAAVKGEVARKALDDKITASVVDTPTVQRLVSEIKLAGTPGGAPADEVKSAHILFSPNGDPQTATTLSASDPAWARAEASADTAYQILKKDPSKFAELAKTESNDTASGADGGVLPWFRESDVDPGFGKAVFAAGLTPGEILPPVKSQFGWHVIRFDGRRADPSIRINTLHDEVAAPGADFAAIAKANSDASDASKGGDMGWIARNQIAKDLEDAIFAAPVGTVSAVYKGSDGWYIFLVRQEATRTPSGDQLTTLKNTAFTNWYADQKKAAAIVEDQVAAQQ